MYYLPTKGRAYLHIFEVGQPGMELLSYIDVRVAMEFIDDIYHPIELFYENHCLGKSQNRSLGHDSLGEVGDTLVIGTE